MAEHVVVFDDFSAGEYGRLGGRRAPKNSFTGTNMLVYRDGSLGPRAGLKNTTPASVPNGKVWAFGGTANTSADGFVVIGNTLYSFDLHTAGVSLTSEGTLASEPTFPMARADSSTDIYLSSFGDKTYKFDSLNLTLTALAGSAGGKCAAVYGSRLAVGNLSGAINRVKFSADADFTTWNADDYFDVGDGWHVSGLYNQRGHLVVTKQNQVFVVTGTLGVDYAVRRIHVGDAVLRNEGAVGRDDRLWVQPIFDSCPAYFDGATIHRLSHLEYTATTPNSSSDQPIGVGVTGLVRPGSGQAGVLYVAASDDKGLLFHNGVWTYHTFNQAVTGFIADSGGALAFATGGGASSATSVWSWDYDYDKPGDGTGLASQGDGSTTPVSASFSLPEWWAEHGHEVTVKEVIVDFTSWDTNATETNHADLVVTALGRFGQSGSLASSTITVFDEANASSSATGTRQRRSFTLGDQGEGGGFQLSFSDIRGVSFQSIVVVCEISPQRGGSGA